MHGWRSIGWVLALALGVALAAPPAASGQVRTLKAVAVAGKRYVALKDLAAMYGLPLTMPGGKALLIRGQYTSLQFTADGREAMLNGSKVWLHVPVIKVRGNWSISDADAQYVVDPLVRPSAYLGARGARTVVLDAGHGGKDPGTSSRTGYLEKDLVLDIALRARAHLAAAGVRVVLTRDGDRFWELEDRPYLAARGAGDVFVSLHLNAAATRTVQGIETFVTAAENHPPTAGTGIGKFPAVPNNQFNHSNHVLGNQLQRALVGITRAEDRGLKHARFVVLRNAAMPAALVECGFLSNAQEAQKLATPSYRESVALGVAQGILNYFALVNRAKVELGAPVQQRPAQMAAPLAPAPAPPPVAPVPMAARAAATSIVVAAPARYAAAPAPIPAAPPPAAIPVQAAPVAAVAPAPAAVPAPAPILEAQAAPPIAPAPLPAVRPAIAPPPMSLLNPNLVTRAQ